MNDMIRSSGQVVSAVATNLLQSPAHWPHAGAADRCVRSQSAPISNGTVGHQPTSKPFSFSHAGLEQALRIQAAAIAKHRDDRVAGAEIARNLHGGGDVDAARAADEESFLAQEPIDQYAVGSSTVTASSIGVPDSRSRVSCRCLR
jgi:hypothetical protein